MGFMKIQYVRWKEMLCLYNTLSYQDEHRLSYKMFEWDQRSGNKGWAGDIRKIYKRDFPQLKTGEWFDLEFLDLYSRGQTHDDFWQKRQSKWKLRSYIEFEDISSPLTLVKSGLHWYTRSVVAKLVCGILPLELETGRYQNVLRENRTCRVCGPNVVETAQAQSPQ